MLKFVNSEGILSDDLHIYPIKQIKILLNLHVLKFEPPSLEF